MNKVPEMHISQKYDLCICIVASSTSDSYKFPLNILLDVTRVGTVATYSP